VKTPKEDGGAEPVPSKGPDLNIHFLNDQPAVKDEFAGQGHGAVARAIGNLVRNEPGGRVIGLQGSWGAGKSTVISLLEDDLASGRSEGDDGSKRAGPDLQLISFDAWAHQGDPLRRSFLEQLLSSLTTWGWLYEKQAKKYKDVITGRTSTEDATVSSRLTAEGVWTSLSILLVPFGAAVFANQFHNQNWNHFLVRLGIACMAAPLLVVLFFEAAVVLSQIVVRVRKKRVWQFVTRWAETPRFSFFAKEQNTKIVTQKIEQGDPTSVEFEELFSKILREVMTEDRRLVIVLDNLDRVEESDARSVFATMQTFTAAINRRSKQEWATRIWTVVPFDLPGLERLWSTGSEDGKGDEGLYASTRGTATAFFEKMFEIRFTVPPLALSDWHTYLLRLLGQALPGRDEEALRAVVRLRDLYCSVFPDCVVAKEKPTPRQLKQFVNQIASILLQRDDIDLVRVAYFALLQRDGRSIPDFLAEPDVAPSTIRYLVGDNVAVSRDLAALHFGTSSELGQETLLKGLLEAALTGGRSDELKSLSQRSGFVEALDALDVNRWTLDGAVELTRSAAVLEEAELMNDPTLTGWVDGILRKALPSASSVKLVDRPSGLGLGVLCALAGKSEATEQAVSRIEPMAGDAQSASGSLVGLAAFGVALKYRKIDVANLRVALTWADDDNMIKSLVHYGKQTPDAQVRALLDVKRPPAQITAALVTAVNTGGEPGTAIDALEVLMANPQKVEVPTLLAEIGNLLRSQDPDAPHLEAQLRLLDAISHQAGGADALGVLAEDGTLTHHLGRANAAGSFASAAYASMLFLQVRASQADPQLTRESQNGVPVLREPLTNPTAYGPLVDAQGEWLRAHSTRAVDFLLTVLTRTPAAEAWVDLQLLALFDTSNFLVRGETIAKSWEVIDRALGTEKFTMLLRTHLSVESKRGVLLSDDASLGLAVKIVEVARGESPLEVQGEILSWAAGLVARADKAEWLAALKDPTGGPLITLTFDLLTLKVELTPSGDLKDSLQEYAVGLQSGLPGWRPEASDFAQFTRLMNAGQRQVLASQLCAGLEGLGGNFDFAFLQVFGEYLVGEASFRKHEKLPNVIEQLVANDKWDQLEWFADLVEQHPDSVSPVGRTVEIDALRAKSTEKANGLDEVPPSLDRIIRALAPSK
jgi:hypothetical protein